MLCASAAVFLIGCQDESGASCEDSPGALFDRKIAPLLTSNEPQTCSQCHAAGLDLADFVRGEPCEAMACLKQEGLVDLDTPEDSVLLSWIGRAEPDSKLITQEVINQEKKAFLSWLRHEALCGTCADIPCPDEAKQQCADEPKDVTQLNQESDPGDCSRTTLERLFRGTVYKNRGRCSPCHFETSTAVEEAPGFIAERGSCQVASLATMLRVTGSGYIDTQSPQESLILTKPLPESEGGIRHGGHDKFVNQSDDAYREFSYFIERYVNCQDED